MRSLVKALAGSCLLLFTLTAANAQYPRGENRYQDRDDYRDQSRLFDRIRSDLDRAESNTFAFTGDRLRIARAREEVNEFQRSWEVGNYDWRQLNDATQAMQRVVDSNRLSDRNRDSLADDLSRMRELQSRY